MSPDALGRLDALPYGQVQVSDEDALAALEAEVARQRTGWRIRADLTLRTAFDPAWNAGKWVGERSSSRAHQPAVQRKRDKMSPDALQRLDALPYGSRHGS